MQDHLSEVALILIGSTLIILVLTGLIVISLFINQKRKYRYRQEKFEMRTNFDEALLRSHIEIQSQAFESISRELHDNVGTLISIAMVHIRSMEGDADEHKRLKITEVDGLLNEAMGTLRDISRSINPENIQRLGWQGSFIAELDSIRKTNLFVIHYSEEGAPFQIEVRKQVIIFRILQETLNNIVKHSNANHIHAHIAFAEPEVMISVQDDGRGFDKKPVDIQGAGIKNMLTRARMLPAALGIESSPEAGTLITLSYREDLA